MKSRDKKTLNEVIHNLVVLSDVLESVRCKLGDDAGDNLVKGQTYLAESIEYFKIGERKIKKAEYDRTLYTQRQETEEETQNELQRGDK